jgi:hypothetical protein
MTWAVLRVMSPSTVVVPTMLTGPDTSTTPVIWAGPVCARGPLIDVAPVRLTDSPEMLTLGASSVSWSLELMLTAPVPLMSTAPSLDIVIVVCVSSRKTVSFSSPERSRTPVWPSASRISSRWPLRETSDLRLSRPPVCKGTS